MDTNKEDYTLKKIRYYQGTIDDYAQFWERKIAESKADTAVNREDIKKKNDDLNKDYVIRPVERD